MTFLGFWGLSCLLMILAIMIKGYKNGASIKVIDLFLGPMIISLPLALFAWLAYTYIPWDGC